MNAPQTATSIGAQTRGVKNVSYSHEAMIELILLDPTVTHKELAEVFSLTPRWVSAVIGSDAFQARLAQKRDKLIDPLVAQSLNERVASTTIQALNVVSEKLEAEQSASYALEALGIVSGVIAKAAGGVHVR